MRPGDVRASQIGLTTTSIQKLPVITQTNSPVNTKTKIEAVENEKSSQYPISIVHLNGSTLFSAQAAPFHSYSASTSTATMSCILAIQKTMVVRIPTNARIQVSFNTPKAAHEQDYLKVALVEGYLGIRKL